MALSEAPLFTLSYEAAADLSSAQYLAITLDANNQAAVSGAAEVIDGVLQTPAPNAGEAVTVMHHGVSFGIAGAAVAIGDNLTTDASGKFIPAVATNPIVGKALSAAGAADEQVSVLLGYRGVA